MEPYLLIVYLEMKSGDATVPPPRTFVRPSRADCLKQADRIRRLNLNHRAECIPESQQIIVIAK